jgi:hypothetical protein
MLLRSPEDVAARGEIVHGSATLRDLAGRLRRLLGPLLDTAPEVPAVKPRLTRDGGVCPRDGTRLTFDPLSPHHHRCPRCGGGYEGERHDHAWLWRYHLWLSERAIHLALLGALDGDETLRRRAAEVLAAYARVYPTVPNRDNVLGPTRLFFSTYLESIWLTQLVTAAMLSGPQVLAEIRTMLDDTVRESAQLIATFDEGWSNRQVWNNTAMVAAGVWLGEDERCAASSSVRSCCERPGRTCTPTRRWGRACNACTWRHWIPCFPTSRCRRAVMRRSGSAWCSTASRSCGR